MCMCKCACVLGGTCMCMHVKGAPVCECVCGGLIVVYVHMNGCMHVEGHVCVHACGGSASR